VSAITSMKLLSANPRGTTCGWTWPVKPAAATSPSLTPMLKPPRTARPVQALKAAVVIWLWRGPVR
jgi:hypothetical protein